MISNTTRELINSALLNLELENPTQETINEATNYLKDAILQIKKENSSTNILCYLQNNTANNITKTSILKDVVGNNNATIENLNNIITEKNNKITELENRVTELESQVANRIDLVELKSVVAELKSMVAE